MQGSFSKHTLIMSLSDLVLLYLSSAILASCDSQGSGKNGFDSLKP